MFARLTTFALFALGSLGASTIDSGVILSRYTGGMGDADVWSLTLSSSQGGYAVQYRVDAATGLSFTCTSPSCLVDPYLPPGYAAILSGRTIGDYGSQGSATVDGVFYPNVGFLGLYYPPDRPGGAFFSSGVHLQSESFIMAPGTFTIPFSMTGHLLALPGGTDFLLDEPITGTGTVMFTLRPIAGLGSPLTFANFAGYPGPRESAPQIVWTFTPEPATSLILCGGVLLLGLMRRMSRTTR